MQQLKACCARAAAPYRWTDTWSRRSALAHRCSSRTQHVTTCTARTWGSGWGAAARQAALDKRQQQQQQQQQKQQQQQRKQQAEQQQTAQVQPLQAQQAEYESSRRAPEPAPALSTEETVREVVDMLVKVSVAMQWSEAPLTQSVLLYELLQARGVASAQIEHGFWVNDDERCAGQHWWVNTGDEDIDISNMILRETSPQLAAGFWHSRQLPNGYSRFDLRDEETSHQTLTLAALYQSYLGNPDDFWRQLSPEMRAMRALAAAAVNASLPSPVPDSN